MIGSIAAGHPTICYDMGTHMKTTIEIADALLEEAKRSADRQGTTLRALVEDGLRRVLKGDRQASSFRLRRATFRGKGLSPALRDAEFDRLRALAYEGRGA